MASKTSFSKKELMRKSNKELKKICKKNKIKSNALSKQEMITKILNKFPAKNDNKLNIKKESSSPTKQQKSSTEIPKETPIFIPKPFVEPTNILTMNLSSKYLVNGYIKSIDIETKKK
eukprot:311739_1